MSLKEKLFPDTNITGYTDRSNQPILVGQKLLDEYGNVWSVVKFSNQCGVVHDEILHSFIEMGMFLSISEWVEIIVQESEHNKASEAMAPFNSGEVRSISNKRLPKTKRSY